MIRSTTMFRFFAVAALVCVAAAPALAQGVMFVTNDRVGIGTSTPTADLDLLGDQPQSKIRVTNTRAPAAQRLLVELINNGATGFLFSDTNNGVDWKFAALPGGNFEVSVVGGGGFLFRFDQDGDLNIQGVLNELSSRDAKENVDPVDGREMLARVLDLPIQSWQYTHQPSGTRHVGPMAEDFHASFGVGDRPTAISALDTSGVALAAIQGLNELVTEKQDRISELEARLAALEATVQALATN